MTTKIVEFMLSHSIATGHGDTEDDLWSELSAAIREKDAKLASSQARIQELLNYVDATKYWQLDPHDSKERTAFCAKLGVP
jgi:hypothetical protein